jgi:hypothetical protein
MKYLISIFFISLCFFLNYLSAANTPTSKPRYTNARFNNDVVPFGDLGEEGANLINSSINIQWAMIDLIGSLFSCRKHKDMFINSIEGKETFEEHLEKEKDKIGDKSTYNIHCEFPMNNIVTKLKDAKPLDGLHMNKLHLEMIEEEDDRLYNSITYFQNEMRRSSKVEDQKQRRK